MKSFIKISGVLFLFLIQFTSCMDDRDNYRKPVYYFYDEPVTVVNLGDNPTIRNESYSFQVPDLVNNNILKAGDLLWTSFIVDLNNDISYHDTEVTDSYTASHFRYRIVDSAKVVIPEDTTEFQSYLSDDYSAAISLATLYRYTIDNLLFFGFKHRDNLNYTYELVLNPTIESNSNYPTLYIRAKQAGARTNDSAISSDGYLIFAFDVTDFAFRNDALSPSDNDKQNKSTRLFNLKYKTGVDKNGKDIYRSFMSNPISWDF